MRRHLPLLLAVVGLAACQRPARSVPATFDSPRDVEFVRWCLSAETLEFRGYCEEDRCGCTDGTDGTALEEELAFAIVANAGGRMVHRVRVDSNDPSYQDLDPSIPGVTGIAVPDGPIDVLPLSHPTLIATISERERAFSVADLVNAELATLRYDAGDGMVDVAGNALPLAEPVTLLRGVQRDGGSTLVLVEPIERRARVIHASSVCGDSATRAAPGCRATVELTELASLALPGTPTDLAVRDDGRVFLTTRDDHRVFVGAAFGDTMTEACGDTPCFHSTLAAARPCRDGVDNDGDGLVDQEDPQCFDGSGEEGPLELVDGSATQCTNGVDDDGDGVLDADDPDCRNAADRVEGAGYDGVDSVPIVVGESRDICGGGGGDEQTLLALPSLASIELPDGVAATLPRCTNGEDDDGDGHVDWPEDEDCYGPNSDSEIQPAAPTLVNVILSEEQDLVYTLDRRTRQLFVHDSETLELIRANELDANHSSLGVALLTEFPGPLIADTAELVTELSEPRTATDASGAERTVSHVRQVERRVHIATTSGFADTIRIDSSWTSYDGDPNENDLEPIEGPLTDWILEPIDIDGARAVVERVGCTDPNPLESGTTAVARCDEGRLPTPALLDDPCDGGADAPPWPPEGSYWELAGGYFAALTTRLEFGFGAESDACGRSETRAVVSTNVSDDFAITGGDWSVVYQGVLNGTERDDGLVMVGNSTACSSGSGDCRGWIEFAGEDPCQATSTEDFCSFEGSLFEASDCPELAGLCGSMSSGDVCAEGIDVCGICPSACRSAVDFCAAGVLPFDTLVVERQARPDGAGDECQPFEPTERGAEATADRLEYVICSVAEAHLEVATMATGCDGESIRVTYETIGQLPPTECFGEPLGTSIRAQDWLVRIGTRRGPSPYHAVDGRCVMRADAEERLMRVVLGEPFNSPLGASFTVAAPVASECADVDGTSVEVFPRDFSIDYDVSRNFGFRHPDARQFLLGPAPSALAIGDTDRGRRLMVVDESQSFLWVFNAFSFREVAPPLP